jgi:hypothetical protein
MTIDLNGTLAYGRKGFIHVTNTDAQSGAFYCIQACVDTVIASVTEADSTGTTAISVPAGAAIFGKFTAFTLTSGKVLAYKE